MKSAKTADRVVAAWAEIVAIAVGLPQAVVTVRRAVKAIVETVPVRPAVVAVRARDRGKVSAATSARVVTALRVPVLVEIVTSVAVVARVVLVIATAAVKAAARRSVSGWRFRRTSR